MELYFVRHPIIRCAPKIALLFPVLLSAGYLHASVLDIFYTYFLTPSSSFGFLSNVAFLHILCFNRNRNLNPNPNPVNLKAKKIECQKSHTRQNSQSFNLIPCCALFAGMIVRYNESSTADTVSFIPSHADRLRLWSWGWTGWYHRMFPRRAVLLAVPVRNLSHKRLHHSEVQRPTHMSRQRNLLLLSVHDRDIQHGGGTGVWGMRMRRGAAPTPTSLHSPGWLL